MTIGLDDASKRAIKVWRLRHDKDDRHTFKHLSTVTVYDDQPYPITCCTALDDLSHIAIGFADGKVILIKGDLVRDRGAKQRTVYEGEEPITGLEFLVSSTSATLYIFSTSKLLTLTTTNASGRSVLQVPRVLESVGAALGCVAKDKQNNEIVILRQDAIYLYGVHGRGPCFAMEGPKSRLHIHRGYAIVIQPTNDPASSALKVLGKIGIPDDNQDASRITVLQTKNKLIGHSGYFSQGLQTLFSEWGYLHLLTRDGRLFRLEEISIGKKLEILYSKDMYNLALSMAQDSDLPKTQSDQIRIRYGDYLYNRGDFEPAVRQYIQAIHQCDTSSIMRKFLEAQHVPLLTEFLEALHEANLSNADYTTLLLNCYAKLKQKDKLVKFIRADADHPIDLEIAVALCRQAGYYDQAISLASKHKNHLICLGIMIEDKHDRSAALKYINKLQDPGDVGIMLNRFGRELMSEMPEETNQLMIDFYTGQFQPTSVTQARGVMSPPRRSTTNYGAAFYESMVNNRYAQVLPSLPSLDMSQFNPMRRVESVAESVLSKESSLPEVSSASTVIAEKPGYPTPAPRTAFSILADYRLHFIHFLEVLLERQMETEKIDDRGDVASALLEVYLEQAKISTTESRRQWEEKAKSLVIQETEVIDTASAMLLFHLGSFDQGSILMQERAGRTEDVFRSYCTAKDTKAVIDFLRKKGENEPHLYTLALKYFTSSSHVVQEAGSELGFVLNKIQEKKLLAPLQVVQALSLNAVATVGIVKTYLSDIIERERKDIRTNRSLIDSYRSESNAKLQEGKDLAETARVLQVSRCSRCGGTLELPVIHFLCKHSFHQRCIPATGDELECPMCQESNDAVHAIIESKAQMAERQDFFKESLAASRDKANFLFSRLDLSVESPIA